MATQGRSQKVGRTRLWAGTRNGSQEDQRKTFMQPGGPVTSAPNRPRREPTRHRGLDKGPDKGPRGAGGEGAG